MRKRQISAPQNCFNTTDMEETECIYGTNSKNYVFLVLLCIYVFFCLGMGKLPEAGGGGRGVLLYMGHIGMCGPKGNYGFSAVLVVNRVSIFAR